MLASLHRNPSVGTLVKKMMEIHPDLTSSEMIALIQQATRVQGGAANEFGTVQVIDEGRVLELARQLRDGGKPS